MEKEIWKILGFVVGVSIFFTIIIVPLFKYFVGQWVKNFQADINKIDLKIDTEIKEIKELLKNIDTAFIDNMKEAYRKIDEINRLCSIRGEKIGKLEGRMNGHNK